MIVAFRSSVLINLVALNHSGGTEKYIKNIKIIEDPFEDIKMKKYFLNIKIILKIK